MMSDVELLAVLRRAASEPDGFSYGFDAYAKLRAAHPELVAPAELAAVDQHFAIGQRAYSKARSIFDNHRTIDDLFEKKSFPKIEGHIKTSLALDPQCAPALIWQATLDRRAGRPADALAALERAVAGEPAHARSHYELAGEYATAGDRARALAHLDRAIQLSGVLHGYHDRVHGDPRFASLHGDPELLALCDPLPRDPELRPIYEHLQGGRYADALRLAATAPMTPAIADVLALVLGAIVADLMEHGEDNAESYGDPEQPYDDKLAHFQAELARVRTLCSEPPGPQRARFTALTGLGSLP